MDVSRQADKALIPPTTGAPQNIDAGCRGHCHVRWATGKFLNERPCAPIVPATSADAEFAENFRHSGWKVDRDRVRRALEASPAATERRRSAFRACGSDAYVEGKVSAMHGGMLEYRIRSTKCKDRFCVPCSRERTYRMQTRLLAWLHGRGNLSLITLTLKQSSAALLTSLTRITKAFRALRALPLWKKAVDGGCAIIETKIGTDGKQWNVHYHIIAQTKFLPQKQLSDAWYGITKDSYICDVKRVGASHGAAKYVTKYISKAADAAVVRSPSHLAESIEAFKGRRLVSSFGDWKGLKLNEVLDEDFQESDMHNGWVNIGSLQAVWARAAIGEPVAVAATAALRRKPFRDSS